MYVNFSDYSAKIQSDEVTDFFEQLNIDVRGYGTWNETDISKVDDFIVPSFQLTYIEQGVGVISNRGIEYECKRGNIFVFSPFEVYSAYSSGGEPLIYSYIAFDVFPYSMKIKFEETICPKGGVLYEHESLLEYAQMFKRLRELVDEKPVAFRYHIKLGLLRMLVAVVVNSESKEIGMFQGKVSSDIVQSAIAYTEKNLEKPIKIAEVARALGVSESLLFKSFGRTFGVSPYKFLTTYKMNKADGLLKISTNTIEQVAEMLGYSSSTHFRSTYKKIMGRAPFVK